MVATVSDAPEFRHLGFYKYPCHYSTLLRLFRSYLRKSFLVLDAGCGDGSKRHAGHLAATTTNMQGIGLDVSTSNIKKYAHLSKTLGWSHLSFLVADMRKMPFRANVFDLIVSADVLEHIDNKKDAIRSIAFSLKRGGTLVMSTSNAFNPVFFIDGLLPQSMSSAILRALQEPGYYERHGRTNQWKLKSLLAKNGLRLKELRMRACCVKIISPTERIPRILYFWIMLNELTNVRFLSFLKEVIIVDAQK